MYWNWSVWDLCWSSVLRLKWNLKRGVCGTQYRVAVGCNAFDITTNMSWDINALTTTSNLHFIRRYSSYCTEDRVSFHCRFLWPCIVSKVWREKNQQDATVRCLLLTSISTCFGHQYAHLQENKEPVTAFGVLFWFCWMWLVAVVGRCLVGCEH